jgi:hypothetical protein
MSRADLHQCIANFILAYRAVGGDPSATMEAAGRAHPGSTMADYGIGLMLANRATVKPASDKGAGHG